MQLESRLEAPERLIGRLELQILLFERSKKRLGEPHEVGFAELHHIAHLEL
jgi:hypothetical protein